MRAAIDRKFEQTLAALINSGEPEIIQGGRKGVEKESLRVTPDGRIAQTPHPRALGSRAHQREHHHRLFRGADRAGLADVPHQLGAAAVPARPAPVRLPAPRRRAAVGDVDAVDHRRRREHPDRAVRHVEHRPHEDRVSQRPRRALRPHDAGHLRRALQLFVPGAHVGSRGRTSCSRASAARPFISDRYFHLLRNYRRHGWIVLYLFGVSPVVCNSFLRGRNVTLPRLSKDTSYEPYATSACA